jgi:hypothetical protein
MHVPSRWHLSEVALLGWTGWAAAAENGVTEMSQGYEVERRIFTNAQEPFPRTDFASLDCYSLL